MRALPARGICRKRRGSTSSGACLVSAGFADFPLISFHLAKAHVAGGTWIAVFYAVAMAVSGSGSLLFGRLFGSIRFRGPGLAHARRGGFRAARVSRRLLGRARRCRRLGARHGRAREHHPRRRRALDPCRPACLDVSACSPRSTARHGSPAARSWGFYTTGRSPRPSRSVSPASSRRSRFSSR